MDQAFYLRRWPAVRAGLLDVVNAFKAKDLHYRAVEGGWPVGRIILHISSAANYWLHSGILSEESSYHSGESTLENYPTIESIKAFLADEHARTLALLKSFNENRWDERFLYPDGFSYPPAWVFWHVLEHEIHHRGELSLLLGLLGREGLDV